MATNQLMELLMTIRVCSRCIANYSKVTVSDVKAESQTNTKESIQDFQHCPSCLGILQDVEVQSVVEKVINHLKSSNYESPDFSLAVSLPQCLVVRQKSLELHMKRNNIKSEVGSRDFIKDILRQCVLPEIEKLSCKKHDNKSNLLVNLIYTYKHDAFEISKLQSLLPKRNNKRKFGGKSKYHQNKKLHHPDNSIQAITNALEKLNYIQLPQYTACPPESTSSPCEVDIRTCQSSLFVAGRYNKFSRQLSQTPWIIDGVKKTETSVQELICEKLQQAVNASEIKFLSSGREDVDVRMLGQGRPFAVELIDPKKLTISKNDLKKLQKNINLSTDMVAVRHLQITNRDGLVKLKQGEEEKTKTYSAKVWCPSPISEDKIINLNSMKNVMLAQKTPIRVLHRRPIDTRRRLVHEVNLKRIDEQHYNLQLNTQAGTYVKEFVHGDFARTVPSLRSLLDAPIDILELDVNAVELDWPPCVEDELVECLKQEEKCTF